MEPMMMDAEKQHPVDLSMAATSMAWKDLAGNFHHHEHSLHDFLDKQTLSDLELLFNRLYLPMEWLLVRHIHLPLKHPNMVDADMIFQELLDSSDIDANDWWLTWRLDICEGGLGGMVFGFPESSRELIQQHEQWSNIKEVVIDGYERLQAYVQKEQSCMVLDQDSDGIFFGVYDGQVWRGMRRLNGSVEQGGWSQILHSCAAMGFDKAHDAVHGSIGQELLSTLEAEELIWQGVLLEDLKTRHEVNLLSHTDNEKPILNMRHGRWAIQHDWGNLKVWKRSAVLATCVLLLFLLSMAVDLNRMDGQIKTYKQRIETAFHQGLPNEPVMLDALAQLRQAAGSNNEVDTNFLSSLQAVSQVYRAKSWQLKSLELRDGEMHMVGEVRNIETLNTMQAGLKKALQKDVKIVDTNMSDNKVSFRLLW